MSIQINKLTDKDVGRWVIYTPQVGPEESGRIKSWDDMYIFVVYSCDQQWDRFQDFTAAATNPDDLKFTNKEVIYESMY